MGKRNYTITGHMVVKNEDRWIWYAIMSVIYYLDKLIIYDTGSIDHTVDIIKDILGDANLQSKIVFEQIEGVTPDNFHEVRQKQIDITNTDYFMVVDGDEIWYKSSLDELDSILSSQHPQLVATRFINCCGDIFHYCDDSRETYCINGIKGAITLRVYSKSIPGIKCGGVYGVEGYIDEKGDSVQNNIYPTAVMDGKYLHTSLLVRSSAQNGDFSIKYRRSKIYRNWDGQFDEDFKFPEVFYLSPLPKFVKSAFVKDINAIRIILRIVRGLKKEVKRIF